MNKELNKLREEIILKSIQIKNRFKKNKIENEVWFKTSVKNNAQSIEKIG